jgi:hypothetical protein
VRMIVRALSAEKWKPQGMCAVPCLARVTIPTERRGARERASVPSGAAACWTSGLRRRCAPRTVNIRRWVERGRDLRLADDEQNEYRGWFWCPYSMTFPTRTKEEMLDTSKPKLKRLPNLQLVVKRLIELEKEPIDVAMNV